MRQFHVDRKETTRALRQESEYAEKDDAQKPVP